MSLPPIRLERDTHAKLLTVRGHGNAAAVACAALGRRRCWRCRHCRRPPSPATLRTHRRLRGRACARWHLALRAALNATRRASCDGERREAPGHSGQRSGSAGRGYPRAPRVMPRDDGCQYGGISMHHCSPSRCHVGGAGTAVSRPSAWRRACSCKTSWRGGKPRILSDGTTWRRRGRDQPGSHHDRSVASSIKSIYCGSAHRALFHVP